MFGQWIRNFTAFCRSPEFLVTGDVFRGPDVRFRLHASEYLTAYGGRSHAFTMRSSGTAMIESQALATLQYIRASMDRAGSVAVPGSAGISVGAIGLAAAALSTDAFHPYWLTVWLCAAIAAAAAGVVLVAHQASAKGFTLFGAPVRKVLFHLVPSIFAGAVLTVVLFRSGNLHVIPGTWLLLYGCALLSPSVVTSRLIAILGGLFVILGCVAFALSDARQTVILGIGFGELHILYGAVMQRRMYGE